VINTDNDEPSPSFGATEHRVVIALRVISVVTLRIGKHLLHVGDCDRSLRVVQRQVLPVEPIPDDRAASHEFSIYNS
jgi:hypothetical protein